MARKAKISRKTKETSIAVSVNLDGKGKYKIKYVRTTVQAFFD